MSIILKNGPYSGMVITDEQIKEAGILFDNAEIIRKIYSEKQNGKLIRIEAIYKKAEENIYQYEKLTVSV